MPSALMAWEKEKVPVLETMPEPEREPLEKSLALMPVPEICQKRVVPGLTLVVATLVVSVSPSLRDEEEVKGCKREWLRLALWRYRQWKRRL